ncbi:hypothetical protein ACIP10_02645 [Streptomyces galbus]|uniref:hypothetical protein n=1 Tax=Streptomyces galbus TaxID=33898 RepID=UPI0037AD84A8
MTIQRRQPIEAAMAAREHIPHRQARRQGGVMAGLFWITPETVYLGAPPSTTPSAVILTPDGLTAVGPQAGYWPWRHVSSVTVADVPAKTTTARSLARLFEVVLGPQSPTEMTVRVETTNGASFGIGVHSAAASAYTIREAALSQNLLDLFVQRRASPTMLTDWLVRSPRSRAPRPAERESLLQRWTETP